MEPTRLLSGCEPKNEIEKRLDSLEKGHIANATAIDSIITDIIPGMEDTEGAE